MSTESIEHYIDAEHYDLTYAGLTEDVDFYVARALEAAGPVLEVACGTGRVLIPTLRAGVEIDGVDILPGMLAVLRRKADAAGLAPNVVEADMRDFTMPRRYALITIPFRAFMHNLTTDDQIRTLRCCREHLEPGGRLILNVFYPSFDRIAGATPEPRLEREFAHPETGLPVAVYATSVYDRVNQVLDGNMEVVERDAGGATLATHHHAFKLRWIFKPEMELLLAMAGFQRWHVAGGFDGRPLVHDTDEMVWTAWKE